MAGLTNEANGIYSIHIQSTETASAAAMLTLNIRRLRGCLRA